jgi:two-component system chemotaxis response regulator CheB
VPKIKAFCPWFAKCQVATQLPRPAFELKVAVQKHLAETNRIDIVAIGSSTGGPNALQTVLSKIPADFPVPIVIVQHMPPIFTKHLADRLHQLTSLNVTEAKRDDALVPGGVWIAPGDYHMTLRRDGTVVRVDLSQGTPENSCRPAVDVLFRSVNELFGRNVLSVVLTGMGQDGARGCEAIRSSGGKVFAQDETTSVVWGMPGAVSQAGLANKIIPLDRIADEIVRETVQGRKTRILEKVGT